MKPLLVLSTLLFCLLPTQGKADDTYKVIFETMDCNGNGGFATVGADEIYKIEDGDCSHPQHPGQKLKQLLIHDGTGSYKAYTLSQEAAKNVMIDVKEYMQARKGVLERSDSIIIGH